MKISWLCIACAFTTLVGSCSDEVPPSVGAGDSTIPSSLHVTCAVVVPPGSVADRHRFLDTIEVFTEPQRMKIASILEAAEVKSTVRTAMMFGGPVERGLADPLNIVVVFHHRPRRMVELPLHEAKDSVLVYVQDAEGEFKAFSTVSVKSVGTITVHPSEEREAAVVSVRPNYSQSYGGVLRDPKEWY